MYGSDIGFYHAYNGASGGVLEYWQWENNVCADTFAGGTHSAYYMTAAQPLNQMDACADDDGTLPAFCVAPVTGVTDNDFLSVDNTSDDFLKLPGPITRQLNANANPLKGTAPLKVNFESSIGYNYPESILINAAITPKITTRDIEGITRPREDGYTSIGCHEPETVWV